MERESALLEFDAGPPLASPREKLKFLSVYDKTALYDAVLRIYTKPLFGSRKALLTSHDGRTLYDFAKDTPRNVERLHDLLQREEFRFREGIEIHHTFNRKQRVIYLFPWEERIVDQLLFQMLNRAFHLAFSAHCYAWRHRGFGVDACAHRIAKCLQTSAHPVYLIKRDIANYFPSVDHGTLLNLLGQWIEPSDYLYRLVEQRVRFRIRSNEGVRVAGQGIPFGTSIACFFANLYLTPLDGELAAIPDLTYCRYADDLLAFSHRREATSEAAERLKTALVRLKLESKATHEKNLLLTAAGLVDGTFQTTPKFRHLGLEFREDGSVGLSRDKGRKIRNLFRYAFRRIQRKIDGVSTPETRAALLIETAKHVIEHGFRSIAIIDYYLKHVDDEGQIKLIDRWLAEEVISRALGTGHRKGNFSRFSFQRLRELGLPSLCHRRRLLRHGRLKCSVFALRTNWRIESERRRLEKRGWKRRGGGCQVFGPFLQV
jgi:hypothetical protein